jgi:hypothetical protein
LALESTLETNTAQLAPLRNSHLRLNTKFIKSIEIWRLTSLFINTSSLPDIPHHHRCSLHRSLASCLPTLQVQITNFMIFSPHSSFLPVFAHSARSKHTASLLHPSPHSKCYGPETKMPCMQQCTAPLLRLKKLKSKRHVTPASYHQFSQTCEQKQNVRA